MLLRVRTCRFCGREMDVSAVSHTQNPFCSACLADADNDACFTSISGTVVSENAAAPLTVQICAPNCTSATVNSDGTFSKQYGTCMSFPFTSSDEAIHVTIGENGDTRLDTQTRYTIAVRPTQAEVSDLGADDMTLDVGELARLSLPTDGAEYTSAGGAAVDDLNGISMDIAAGQLDDGDTDGCTVRVFNQPLGEDAPRFVPEAMTLDALFFLSPYFQGTTPDLNDDDTPDFTGVDVRISAEAVGWSDGDSGTFYVLGEYANSNWGMCPGTTAHIPLGELSSCGAVTASGGEILIENVAVFGWIGLAKSE